MRLIDADRFKEYITVSEDVLSLFKTEEFNQLVVSTMEAILRDIDAQPTVDAVEVVRCEFCEHYVGEMFFGREVFWCNRKYKQGSGMMELTDFDDFCSYGERKTDG